MSPRKPPRLASWLLNRSGLARQNPPLAGDLQEEFGRRGSAAWYWRQTLVAIGTGLTRNVRRGARRLTGAVIGWAAQAGIAFVLWRFRLLPQPTHVARMVGVIATAVLLIWFAFFRKIPRILHSGTDESLDLPVTKSLAASAVDEFIPTLSVYCIFALVADVTLSDFIVVQSVWFFSAVSGALFPARRRIIKR